jgi:hypothetical protein
VLGFTIQLNLAYFCKTTSKWIFMFLLFFNTFLNRKENRFKIFSLQKPLSLQYWLLDTSVMLSLVYRTYVADYLVVSVNLKSYSSQTIRSGDEFCVYPVCITFP